MPQFELSGLFSDHAVLCRGKEIRIFGKAPAHTPMTAALFDAADQLLDIYIEYESGRRINIETKKESEIRGFDALIEALCAYLDPLFG